MEFGIFVQGHVPRARVETDGDAAEHNAIVNEMELVEAADRHGWKYVWVTEHHFLTEYSHLSANEVVLGYLAKATNRIHIGSGIFNLNPHVNHPYGSRNGSAMLDHLCDGRFELGTGRGAGSREVTGFDIEGHRRDEGRCGTRSSASARDVGARSTPTTAASRAVPGPNRPTRNVLPKPWKKPHPPMWVGARQPAHLREGGAPGPRRARLQRGVDQGDGGDGAVLQERHRRRRTRGRLHQRQRDDHQRRRLPGGRP